MAHLKKNRMSTVQYSLLWKIKHWVFATVTVTWNSGNTSSVDPSAPTILRPGFKWQAQYLRFFQIIFKLCLKRDENLTKKWPFFLKKNSDLNQIFQVSSPLFSSLHQFTSNQFSSSKLPMARFEPRSSGVGRDWSANCATTTAKM